MLRELPHGNGGIVCLRSSSDLLASGCIGRIDERWRYRIALYLRIPPGFGGQGGVGVEQLRIDARDGESGTKRVRDPLHRRKELPVVDGHLRTHDRRSGGTRLSTLSMCPLPSFRLLGVRVHAVQIPDAVAQMEQWIRERHGCHYVAVTGMHGVMEAQHDGTFKKILNTADMVVSDGMPLVWAGRRYGYPMKRRVYGPELMLTFCQQTARKGYRHFFYGGASDVPGELARTLDRRFPGINVVGTYSPPFRPLTEEEDRE